MLLLDVSKLILLLKKHSKRLIKIQLLSDFILNHCSDDSMLLFDILSGNYSREISKKELGISLKTILNALSICYEIPQKTIEKEFFKHGDIFELTSTIDSQKNSIHNKISTAQTQHTLKDVTQALVKISNTSGKNSNASKINIILFLFSKPKRITFKGEKKKCFEYEVEVHEGKKHIIRKFFGEFGYIVKSLKRTKIGNLDLFKLNLKEGEYKEIREKILLKYIRK